MDKRKSQNTQILKRTHFKKFVMDTVPVPFPYSGLGLGLCTETENPMRQSHSVYIYVCIVESGFGSLTLTPE